MNYKVYNNRNIKDIPQLSHLSHEQRQAIKIVSKVLPFKTNNYVLNELIDWKNFENDPMFILNFPQKGMLSEQNFKTLSNLINLDAPKKDQKNLIADIRRTMNPHPAGQMEHNVPMLNGKLLEGVQHKYRETVLFFPSQGQTCHAYCTFCFRWPQFTGNPDLKFSTKQTKLLIAYLKQNPEVSDILITGGDPLVMKTSILSRYINAILDANLPQIKTIRIGTKSLSFWPYRFLTEEDSSDLLKLFKKVSRKGIHLAIMSHFNHYRELGTEAVGEAVYKIRKTGAQIRTQSPLLNHINAEGDIWARMWRQQVDMGMIPYYMFMARNTGAQDYFGVDMQTAINIYQSAYQKVSGICRTVRGPSLSTGPGKIQVLGTSEINGEKVFVLHFIQGRLSEWVGQPFFAKYNPGALWLDELMPAFGKSEFFFEREYKKLLRIDRLPGITITRKDLQSA